MDRLIYTSLSAMRGAMARQTATAHNLANANTPGFRADMAAAQALWLKGEGHTSRAPASEEVIAASMKPGVVTRTGRDLDIAIDGDAMLAVNAEDGSEAYTRRGDLAVSDSGLLTNGEERPVIGNSGPIILPAADRIGIDAEGNISIVPVGGDPAQPQLVDRLRLASPAGSAVKKGLDGLFRVEGGGALPADPDARVIVGHLEAANVSATEALVAMVEASRAWDAQLRLLGDARDMDSASADLMRLPE